MFERRHYEAVARVVGEYLVQDTMSSVPYTRHDDLVDRFVILFEIGNPRFDSEKFIRAVNKVKVTPRVVRVRKDGEEGRN